MTDTDVYRVQQDKPWYRRTWQAEWPGCDFAARGYTKQGLLAGVWVRRRWGARMEDRYRRVRVIVRRLDGYSDGWYREHYTWAGVPR